MIAGRLCGKLRESPRNAEGVTCVAEPGWASKAVPGSQMSQGRRQGTALSQGNVTSISVDIEALLQTT